MLLSFPVLPTKSLAMGLPIMPHVFDERLAFLRYGAFSSATTIFCGVETQRCRCENFSKLYPTEERCTRIMNLRSLGVEYREGSSSSCG